MADVKFELNLSGLNELMKSAEMEAVLDEAGAAVASAAGAEYGHRVHQANFVALCNVYPDSKEAAEENFEENTLIKALSQVGLSMSK